MATTVLENIVCRINACDKPIGVGTWMQIRLNDKPLLVAICEEHWQAIRNVR